MHPHMRASSVLRTRTLARNMRASSAAAPARVRRSNFLFVGVFSSTTLLTYILFWMIAYNLCHIF